MNPKLINDHEFIETSDFRSDLLSGKIDPFKYVDQKTASEISIAVETLNKPGNGPDKINEAEETVEAFRLFLDLNDMITLT